MTDLPAAVSFVRVTKRFGATEAVSRITVSLRSRELVCIVGPNGSGKSTLLGLAAGLATPTVGEVRRWGVGHTCSRRAARRGRIGYLPQETVLYEHLTALEHLRFMAQLSGRSQSGTRSLEDALDAFGLGEQAHRRIGLYSVGMKRKVALLCALAHDPDLILLDEPFSGLDTPGIARSVALLKEARERGTCILVATHRPSIVTGIADRWLVLRDGHLISDRPTALGTSQRVGCEPKGDEPRFAGAVG